MNSRAKVTLNFFWLKALRRTPLSRVESGTLAWVSVPYLSAEMPLVISHLHLVQL